MTYREYELTGILPRCKTCGKELDEENDIKHDGYKGSSHAHNGMGSYGMSNKHFVFFENCENCRAECKQCSLKEEWNKQEEETRYLALWEEIGGMLCECEGYWLVNNGNEFLHSVKSFFAWDSGDESRKVYVELVKDIRNETGEHDNIKYIPQHKQKDFSKALEVLDRVRDAGLEINDYGTIDHKCK